MSARLGARWTACARAPVGAIDRKGTSCERAPPQSSSSAPSPRLSRASHIATPPSGLTSELLARGSAGTFRVHDENLGLKLRARQPTDIAVVRARLEDRAAPPAGTVTRGPRSSS